MIKRENIRVGDLFLWPGAGCAVGLVISDDEYPRIYWMWAEGDGLKHILRNEVSAAFFLCAVKI